MKTRYCITITFGSMWLPVYYLGELSDSQNKVNMNFRTLGNIAISRIVSLILASTFAPFFSRTAAGFLVCFLLLFL
jgi:hypothetical protein